jgi:AraC-like DNA-binding protein
MSEANDWLNPFVAQGIVLIQARLDRDWGVQLPRRSGIFFHFVLEGHAYVRDEGGETIKLLSGDILLVGQGTAHQVSHRIESQTVPVDVFLSNVSGQFSTAVNATSIVCGFFNVEAVALLAVVKSMPNFLHLEACNCVKIAENLKQLRYEVRRNEFGSQMLIKHLLSIIFIYILREWERIKEVNADVGLSVAQRRQIASALACIHEKPFYNWTLDSLAQSAGLSRSAFAKLFTKSVGSPPHTYLTHWRMGLAAQMLKQTDLSIAEIALRVGYASQYSFSKIFKQLRGLSPGQVRNNQIV